MSDEPKKGSGLPFSPPVKREGSNLPFTPPPPRPVPTKAPINKPEIKTPISNKKQLKNAKKAQKRPISVRNLFTGLFILVATAVAVTAVISPDILNKVASGQVITKTETCTITETNSSYFFDTDCGRFEWDKERQPGTPKEKLIEGETYTITASGFRAGIAHMYPSVMTFTKVEKK